MKKERYKTRTHPLPICDALPPLYFGREGGDWSLRQSGVSPKQQLKK